jgi:hypothetical protein
MNAEKQKALPTRMAWCGLPGLFLLWANLHPGFVLGLFLLGALSLWSFLSSPKEPGRWGAFLAIFLLCATTTLINPQGFELHRSILALQQSSYFMQLHEEWRPVSFGSPEGELFLSALSVIVLGVVLGRGERRVGGVLAFCFVLFFAWASLRAVRMVPFFGIVAAYPIACALLSLGRTAPFLKFSSFRRLAQAFQFFEDREMSARRCGALWILLSAALVGMSLVSGHLGLFHGPFGPPATRYPYGAIEALLQSRAQRGETSPWVVAAASEWGGFITFQGQRLLRPLLDDRNTLIGERYYQDFEEHIGKGRGWEEFLDSQNADAVLLLPHMPLIKAFKDAPRPGWELLYQDSLASVLVRKQGQDID